MGDWEPTEWSAVVSAVATIVLVAVTGFYAWRTHAMAKEMREQREAAARPVLDFFSEYAIMGNFADMRDFTGTFRLPNVGTGAALNVTAVDATEDSWGVIAAGESKRDIQLDSREDNSFGISHQSVGKRWYTSSRRCVVDSGGQGWGELEITEHHDHP